MAASRARWLVTASRTGRGGKAAPALLKWTTLATPGVSDLSDGTSSAMTTSREPGGGDDAHTRCTSVPYCCGRAAELDSRAMTASAKRSAAPATRSRPRPGSLTSTFDQHEAARAHHAVDARIERALRQQREHGRHRIDDVGCERDRLHAAAVLGIDPELAGDRHPAQSVRKRAVEEHACKLAVGDFRQELLDEHLRGRLARHRPRHRARLAEALDTLDAGAAGVDAL